MQFLSVFLNKTNVADFWLKNADISRTQGYVLCIMHFFWIFFKWGISVPSFIIVGYVWQILGRGISPHPWAASKMPILNSIKTAAFLDNNWKSFTKRSIFDDVNFIIKILFNGVVC